MTQKDQVDHMDQLQDSRSSFIVLHGTRDWSYNDIFLVLGTYDSEYIQGYF